jgi:hypothetical protein
MISPALDSNKFQKDNRLMSGYPIELLSENTIWYYKADPR